MMRRLLPWKRLLLLLNSAALLVSGVAGQQTTRSQADTRPGEWDCAHLDQIKEGRPVFVGDAGGVRFGISTKKEVVAFGEPILVDIWVDNRSDKPILVGGRCPPDYQLGDIFDHFGHRVPGLHERSSLDSEKNHMVTTIQVCASTGAVFEIPAHTCKGPAQAGGYHLPLDHKLGQGVYYVFPTRGTDPALFKQGLMITVREP